MLRWRDAKQAATKLMVKNLKKLAKYFFQRTQ